MDFTLLTEAGINVEEDIKRFGNEKLFANILQKFLEEPSYKKLIMAVENNDEKDMLAQAHALKGLCGFLSLTPLAELFTEQVALLRAGEREKALDMMPEINRTYKKITDAITKWLNEMTLSVG